MSGRAEARETGLTRRAVLRGLAGGSAAVLAAARGRPAAAADDELVVTMFGGAMEQGWRRTVIEPFEKQFKVRVTVASGTTLVTLAKMRAEKGNPQMDVVVMDSPGAVPAAAEGLWEKLDPARIPVMKELPDWAIDKDRNYVSWLTAYYGLAYNTQKVKEPPASWEDLFKPEYKGRVIFPDMSNVGATYLLHVFAILTGGDINSNNVESAFRKVKALRPSVLTLWTSHDQVAQLLTQGEAWIGPWPSDRAITIKAQGAPIGISAPREGVPFNTSQMGIVKGTKRRELAEKYINFALGAEAQQRASEAIFIGPTNPNAKVPSGLARDLGIDPAAPLKKLPPPDFSRIAAYRDGWVERWNREIR